MEFRKKLPSYAMKEEVVQLVRNNQVVVLTGETGCGYTTKVPQFPLEDSLAGGMGSTTTRIVGTLPTRISAIMVAEGLARGRGWWVLESSPYCTTIIVLSWLRSLPALPSLTWSWMRCIRGTFSLTS